MTVRQVALEPLVLARLSPRPAATTDVDLDFDRRWGQWLAEGRVRDVRMRRRMHWVAWLVAAGLVLWSALALLPAVVRAADPS
jgi:hypothetical protein